MLTTWDIEIIQHMKRNVLTFTVEDMTSVLDFIPCTLVNSILVILFKCFSGREAFCQELFCITMLWKLS